MVWVNQSLHQVNENWHFYIIETIQKHRLREDHESTIVSAEVMLCISFVSGPLKMDYAIAILKNKLNIKTYIKHFHKAA